MPVKELSTHFEFASWRVPQLRLSIEYPLEVMEEIRAFACDELLQLSHGGDEVGGVLFGTRHDDLIRVLTWRPMACEHTKGESLRLSYNDRMNLAVQLEVARQNEDLKDLRPVGWFVSHLRGSVALSDSDLEIYNGFFPEAWQTALVICHQGNGRAQAGFFMREADGKLQTEASYQTFDLAPVNAVAAARKVAIASAPEVAPLQTPPASMPKEPEEREVAEPFLAEPRDLPAPAYHSSPVQASPVQASPVQAPAVQAPPLRDRALPASPLAAQGVQTPAPRTATVPAPPVQAPPVEPAPHRSPAAPASAVQTRPLQAPTFQIDEEIPTRERWVWAIPILLALSIAVFMLYQRRTPSSNAATAFRASSDGQTVQLTWDGNSPAIRDSFRGEMEINDGSKTSHVALTSDQLHAGKMSYARQSGDIGFALTVYPAHGDPIHDSTRLIAPGFDSPTQPPQLIPANPVAAAPIPASPPPANPIPATPATPAPDQSALQQQVERLREELSKERAHDEELQNLVRILENRLGIAAEPGRNAPRH
jgi:proteasome lid subunit RPN8/RPN11